MKIEKWQSISGYERLYEASSLGRIRGLKREAVFTLYSKEVRQKIPSRILNGHIDKRGYRLVTLSRGGVSKNLAAAHFICGAFHGPRPKGKECAHLDGSKDNDTPENLKWVAHSENMAHMVKHGASMFGERNNSAKLKEGNIREIRRRFAAGETCSSISKDFPVTNAIIERVTKRRAWRHVE